MAGAPTLGTAFPAQRPRGLRAAAAQVLAAQSGHLFPWVPVCLGTGIAIWFALPVEPGPIAYACLALVATLAVAAGSRSPGVLRPLAFVLAITALGALLAGARAAAVAEPVLQFRYYGPVEGRIVGVDRSSADRLRLTLDRVVLERMDPAKTPARVRVSLHSATDFIAYETGQTVILTAHLAPPPGPLEPGDFDFRRHAWFEGLGAVGYTRTPVLLLAPAEGGASLWLGRLRQHLAAAVAARIPGDAGGYAAAVTTGDRSGLSAEANQAMRDSNLYHLVSISGMHMGMLAAFVFALVRYGLAAVPPLALRLPVKKLAAAAALAAGAFYLALAGRDVATERAFVMVAVMLVAVLFDRRALSLRSVAAAALVVLVLRPESLLNPGFQMSFAATLALVAAFEGAGRLRKPRHLAGRLVLPVATLVFSSLVAGSATGPFAAAHFNRIAEYGLVANLLAVPAMGLLVMPGAVILAITAPLGLDQPAVWMIEAGSRWILYVADLVAGLDGSVSAVPSPPGAVVPLLAVGGLWLVLWRGAARWAGIAPPALAFALWAVAERPALLVAPDGSLVGVLAGDERRISKPSEGLAARGWRENDGALSAAGEGEAALFAMQDGIALERLGATEVAHVFGRGWEERLARACTPGRIVVTAQEAGPLEGGCTLFDARKLEATGAVVGWLEDDGTLRLEASREREGRRWWTGYGPGGRALGS